MATGAPRARPKTKGVSGDDWIRMLNAFIERRFPPEKRERVNEVITRFSPNGMVVIVSLLAQAEKEKKFDEAVALVREFWEEYWQFQDFDVRGDPNHSRENIGYLRRAYTRLGLNFPPQSSEDE